MPCSETFRLSHGRLGDFDEGQRPKKVGSVGREELTRTFFSAVMCKGTKTNLANNVSRAVAQPPFLYTPCHQTPGCTYHNNDSTMITFGLSKANCIACLLMTNAKTQYVPWLDTSTPPATVPGPR